MHGHLYPHHYYCNDDDDEDMMDGTCFEDEPAMNRQQQRDIVQFPRGWKLVNPIRHDPRVKAFPVAFKSVEIREQEGITITHSSWA